MTSLVQVAMVGECRRTSDCERCMQRGVDACTHHRDHAENVRLAHTR